MNKKQDKILYILAIGLAVILVLTFVFNFDLFTATQNLGMNELNLDYEDNDFTRFAVVAIFLYDTLPTIAQQFSISAISVQLLISGFSPLILAILSAVGLLTGQMILYVVGMFLKKVHKGSIGDIAGKNHWLHKYHFLVFMAIPFIGILGDAGMIYAGHQRANPLKIMPFLFIADLASTARWILPTMAELEIGDALQ